MVYVNYTETSNDMIVMADGERVIYNVGDMSWMMTSTALVFIMSPGVGYFYSGLLRRKNALQMLFLGLAIFSAAAFQWFFWGYSLAFGEGSKFIGNLDHFGLIGVLEQPSPGSDRIPSLMFAIYQSMFGGITAVLAFGACAERGRILPLMFLVFLWMTIVYCPIANWTWNGTGWSFIMGTLDYAGGGPVHMNSGMAALAYSVWVGKRRGYGTDAVAYKPNNVSNVVLGTTLLWFGWFGFNGGSALSANLRAIQSMVATNLAAAVAGLTWIVLDWRVERKWSVVGLCSGIVAGLVGITPAAGYVGTPSAMAVGCVTAVACNFATKIKFLIKVDEPLDVFAIHGVGGFVGALMTGLLADTRVSSFDGFTEGAGWINHNYVQFGYQLADSVAISAYSFVVTSILCVALNYIPGLKLRASEEGEVIGMDEDQVGESTFEIPTIPTILSGSENAWKTRDEEKDGEATPPEALPETTATTASSSI